MYNNTLIASLMLLIIVVLFSKRLFLEVITMYNNLLFRIYINKKMKLSNKLFLDECINFYDLNLEYNNLKRLRQLIKEQQNKLLYKSVNKVMSYYRHMIKTSYMTITTINKKGYFRIKDVYNNIHLEQLQYDGEVNKHGRLNFLLSILVLQQHFSNAEE